MKISTWLYFVNKKEMFHKNIYLIWLLVLPLSGFWASAQSKLPPDTKKWVVSENSTLSVNGTTNINKFSCDILAYDQTDTLLVTRNKTNKEIALSGIVNLGIESFDCHNIMMTHDLRKTLKAKQFPKLRIRFLSLNKLPNLTLQPELITGLVNIELAGASKRFEVNYHIYVDGQNVIHLLGLRDINFTDFNLEPPTKLGGMIRTEDKLVVNFHLKIKAID